MVAFIFREEVYKRDREDLRGLAELIIAKQRNGPIGKVDLVFLHHPTKFENPPKTSTTGMSSYTGGRNANQTATRINPNDTA